MLKTLVAASGACQATPEAPARPTWADVAPILQGECNHCHGATAATTGAVGSSVYRFDFFDMNAATCGDAAAAVELPGLAAANAALIKSDIARPQFGRPRMPPAPASVLEDWQRETIERWTSQPIKGPPPPGNRRPRIDINQLSSTTPQGQLSFIATIDDPDADSVIGVIKLADRVFKMDHPGSFAVSLDLTGLPAGSQRLTATLCDGWDNLDFDLGPILIRN